VARRPGYRLDAVTSCRHMRKAGWRGTASRRRTRRRRSVPTAKQSWRTGSCSAQAPPASIPGLARSPDGVAEQTEQALLNLAAILEAAGSSIAEIVKTTIFYPNVEDFATINEVYARHMPDPPPARSAPANVALPRGLLISIEAIATVESGG
jgi:2-iminobutanoate/2-iminopropanoate deaminase